MLAKNPKALPRRGFLHALPFSTFQNAAVVRLGAAHAARFGAAETRVGGFAALRRSAAGRPPRVRPSRVSQCSDCGGARALRGSGQVESRGGRLFGEVEDLLLWTALQNRVSYIRIAMYCQSASAPRLSPCSALFHFPKRRSREVGCGARRAFRRSRNARGRLRRPAAVCRRQTAARAPLEGIAKFGLRRCAGIEGERAN